MATYSSMDTIQASGCGCAACHAAANDPNYYDNNDTQYNEQTATSISFNYSGVTFSDGTIENAVDSVFSGRKWATTDLTFSFPNSTADYGNSYSGIAAISSGFAAMSTDQQEAIRYIYDMVESFSGLQFTELTGSSDANADLMHAHSNDPSTAYAYYPSTNSVGGDAFYGGSLSTTHDPQTGTYQFQTIMHEIGHTFGLRHGHESTGSGATPTQYAGQEYSIMTYLTDETDNSSSGYTLGSTSYPQSFMMLDIAALQQMYGANFTTNSTDTTYTFSTSTGTMYINGVDQLAAASVGKNGSVIFRTVWDGGGSDTYDFSNFSNNLSIDLNPGEYVDLDVGGNSQRALLDFVDGDYASGHVFNALQYNDDSRSLIENAIGGSGNDSIYGNIADNVLNGGLGDDTLYASAGSDTLDGDGGTDSVNYSSYNISDFLVTLVDTVTLTLQHIVDSWTDTIRDIENFIFNDGSYTFEGMDEFDSSIDDIGIRFDHTDGIYNYTSDAAGSQTITAENMSYSSQSGDMIAVSRTSSEFTINVLNGNAPDTINIWASDDDDHINITGTHASMGVNFYAKDGDDYLGISSTIVGDDVLGGDGGNDEIRASGGNDLIYGGTGNDTLFGDAGDDTIYGGDDNDTIYGDNQARSGVSGNDILTGEAGDDNIFGGDGNDTIYGGDDNDVLGGDGGADTVYGGTGTDTIYGNAGADNIYGEDGNDTIYADNVSRTDVVADDFVIGGAGDDTIYGGAGDDRLYGDNYNRSGGVNGNDVIHGDAGIDQIFGGEGNDTLHGGDDNDVLAGDDGNDTLNGDAGADQLWGHSGNDTLNGGNGDDVLYSDFLNESVNDGDDILNGGDGNDILISRGGNDTLNGGSGIDQLWGGTGTDSLEGGAGVDVINGGDGIDTVIYSNESSGITVNLSRYFALDGGGSRDSIEQVENVDGSAYNDRIEGNTEDNTLNGNAGNDYLYGWNGADTLNGGSGADVLYGGNHDDTLNGGDDNDTLAGDTGNDTLNGDDGADQLWGHSGNDTLNGGDGDDILYSDYLNETVNDGDDILNGGGGSDTLVGRGGADTLNGGTGNDTLWGGTGADTFDFDTNGGVDNISDFNLGQGDKIDISDLISGFYTNPDGQAIEDFVQITSSNGSSIVSVDVDGGGNSFVQIATILGVTGLTDEDALESNGTLIV